MPAKYIYRISADGQTITGLWHDFLTKVSNDAEVFRASEVEFDNEKQLWSAVIIIPGAPRVHLGWFKTRKEALRMEMMYINCLIGGEKNGEETGSS